MAVLGLSVLVAAAVLATSCAREAVGDSKSTEPRARPTQSTKQRAPAPASAPGTKATASGPRTEMRNLRLMVLDNAILEVRSLTGHLERTKDGVVPFFDDPTSFRIVIERADTSIDAKSLAALLNGYTFAYEGSPLEDLEVELKGDRLVQKGKLTKLHVSFEIEASLSLTDEGLLRLHPEKIESAGVPVKGALDLFDVELQDVLNARADRGLRVEGDDLLLDPERLMPPPAIRGRVGSAKIVGDRILLGFVPTERVAAVRTAPMTPPLRNPNYLFFRGAQLRFGKLEMRDTDLAIFDADPKDPFLFYLSKYQAQLCAGYTRTLSDLGLIASFPDYDEATGSGSTAGSAAGSAPRGPGQGAGAR